MKRTEIANLGEFGLINKINASNELFHYGLTIKAIGDDAAVMAFPRDMQLLFATDMLVEGIHFDLTYVPLKHLGYKAVAVNLSDIAAMNGVPAQITVSLGLSNRFSVEAVEELYAGIKIACQKYKVDLVGGDTSASRSGLIISVAVVGYAPPESVVYRSGAKPGDILCVSGDLGAAYMGLQVLNREKVAYEANPEAQPEINEDYAYIIGRQLKPEARTDVVIALREVGVRPTAMIDVSDGLASEVLHLCQQSNVGMVVVEEKLPVDNATLMACDEFGIAPGTAILNGGEDYELLFTIAQNDYDKIRHMADITPIGMVKPKGQGAILLLKSGENVQIKAQGWKHFEP